MDKEVVVHIYNGILLSHKKEQNGHLQTCGWIQRLSQSEVSQKEKNKYRILTHICGTQKNGTDEPVGVQGRNKDTDVENKRMDTEGEMWWWRWWCDELGDWD